MQEVHCTKRSSCKRIDTATIKIDLRRTSDMWEYFTIAKLDEYELDIIGMSSPILTLMLANPSGLLSLSLGTYLETMETLS